jgi:hypothetical protein
VDDPRAGSRSSAVGVRFEQKIGNVAEDRVVRDERHSESDSRRGDPSVGVVLALRQRVADCCAVGAYG